MKASELMVGDWIYNTHNKQYEQVKAIEETRVMLAYNDLYDYVDIQPIPLTEEVLEKNGFKKWTWYKYHKDDTVTYAVGNGCHVEIEERMINGKNEKIFNLVNNCNDDSDYGYESNYICDVQYVHKLQNALKVLEIEEEIVL